MYDLNGKELCGERVIVEHTKGPRRDGGYGGRSKCSMNYLFYMHNVIAEGSCSVQGDFDLNFDGAKSKTCPWWLMCIQFYILHKILYIISSCDEILTYFNKNIKNWLVKYIHIYFLINNWLIIYKIYSVKVKDISDKVFKKCVATENCETRLQ